MREDEASESTAFGIDGDNEIQLFLPSPPGPPAAPAETPMIEAEEAAVGMVAAPAIAAAEATKGLMSFVGFEDEAGVL